MRSWLAGALAALLIPLAALSHSMPGSTVRLAPAGRGLSADVLIPLSELEAALGERLPAAKVPARRAMLEGYLSDHVSLTTVDGLPWGMRVEAVSTVRDHDHSMLSARLGFVPPAGPDKGIVLNYDAVLHKVASHYALVSLDAGGREVPLARLQAPDFAVKVADPAGAAPAVAQKPKAGFAMPKPVEWAYLAVFLGIIAIAANGFRAWRRKLKG